MRVAVVALFGLAVAVQGSAQVPSSEPPHFDVISVKPNVSGVTGHNDLQGKAYVGEGVTVASLIALANDGVPNSQILGGADWIRTETFDIRATFEGNPARTQIQAMLGEALRQRFKLQAHFESRPTPVLQLVISGTRPGPSLKPSTLDCGRADNLSIVRNASGACMFHYNNGHIEGRGITIDQLASKLIADRVVVNKTGLAGLFDLELQWTPAAVQMPADDALPSLVTALREQLGLRLESGTVPVSVLVIDHVEHPTEN